MPTWKSWILSVRARWVANAREIATVQEVYTYLAEHYTFQPGEAELLLRLDDPLGYISGRWPQNVYDTFPVEDKVAEDIWELSQEAEPLQLQESGSVKDRLQRLLNRVHAWVILIKSRTTRKSGKAQNMDCSCPFLQRQAFEGKKVIFCPMYRFQRI